jgi:tungstate transport system substrate-binding protein
MASKHCKLWLRLAGLFMICSAVISAFQTAASARDYITVQSTTSTENSGLYDYLLPQYTRQSGVDVKVVSVGTGQALRNAQNCDGDLLIVHATRDEEIFVRNGYGTARYDLMYNDFVIVGPTADPANLGAANSAMDALQRLAAKTAKFASRGDNSGTHKAEILLWQKAGIAVNSAHDSWYLETGLGMGATLNFAVQAGAYTISDRATWLAFRNRSGHKILYQGDPPLFNQYGVVPVSKSHCANTKVELANDFIRWLLGSEGQGAIASFRRSDKQLFFPNARK